MAQCFETVPRMYAQLAKFILGERLQRNREDSDETMLTAGNFNSEHIATAQKDFAFAV
jgi:hypothetical protein